MAGFWLDKRPPPRRRATGTGGGLFSGNDRHKAFLRPLPHRHAGVLHVLGQAHRRRLLRLPDSRLSAFGGGGGKSGGGDSFGASHPPSGRHALLAEKHLERAFQGKAAGRLHRVLRHLPPGRWAKAAFPEGLDGKRHGAAGGRRALPGRRHRHQVEPGPGPADRRPVGTGPGNRA